MLSKQPKVALVHDDFIQKGGAESLFATIAIIWPEAPIYTSLVNWKKIPKSIEKKRVKTSFLQKIPFAIKLYKGFLPLFPFAFESFNFSKYDIVISSTTRFAKGIVTGPNTVHVCYINSTPRFLWDKKATNQYLPEWLMFLATPVTNQLKKWDKAASSRVDFYIANSHNVQHNIKRIYGHESEVIYPFADLDYFKLPKVHNWELKSKDYYLIVARLVKWKRVDIAIKAALTLNANLIIVGTGPDEKRLKKLAGGNPKIEFIGRVNRKRLRELYQNAQALIMTQKEDFGISAVEAQACGTPVIAYKHGGQAEIIIDKESGVFFEKQTRDSLQDAILAHSKVKWTRPKIRKNSLRFSREVFVSKIKKQVESVYASTRQ
ncbi:MAG: glycosyltransferase [Candidatus Curtissbacteria bacterium]|nr:glycosyltransferase [Candidatus Curtissbacteria bacterium]